MGLRVEDELVATVASHYAVEGTPFHEDYRLVGFAGDAGVRAAPQLRRGQLPLLRHRSADTLLAAIEGHAQSLRTKGTHFGVRGSVLLTQRSHAIVLPAAALTSAAGRTQKLLRGGRRLHLGGDLDLRITSHGVTAEIHPGTTTDPNLSSAGTYQILAAAVLPPPEGIAASRGARLAVVVNATRHPAGWTPSETLDLAEHLAQHLPLEVLDANEPAAAQHLADRVLG